MPTRRLGPQALASKLRSYLASECPKLGCSRLSTAALDLLGALEEQMAGRLSIRPAPSTAAEVYQLHASIKQQLARYVQRKTRENKRHAAVKTKARSLAAHAMLTLGKVPFGEAEPEPEARPAHSCCVLKRFTSCTNEKHQCGYCNQRSYFYCATCFPDEKKAEYAICNPCSKDRPCFHRHIINEKPTHKMQHIKKRKAAEPTRASPRRTSQARTGPGADPGVGAARRRIDPNA